MSPVASPVANDFVVDVPTLLLGNAHVGPPVDARQHSCVFSNVLQTSSGVVNADATAPAPAPDMTCDNGS